MNNFINLQMYSEDCNDSGGVNLRADSIKISPIEKQGAENWGELITSETNYEKFSKLLSHEVSTAHEIIKSRKQEEDVWNEAYKEYKSYWIINHNKKLTIKDFIEWVKENYTLIKK